MRFGKMVATAAGAAALAGMVAWGTRRVGPGCHAGGGRSSGAAPGPHPHRNLR